MNKLNNIFFNWLFFLMLQNTEAKLIHWSQNICSNYDIEIINLTSSWENGLAFAAIIHYFEPDLIDFNALKNENNDGVENIERCLKIFNELQIPDYIKLEDVGKDKLMMMVYLSEIYKYFTQPKYKEKQEVIIIFNNNTV